ncbi:MAG TPA: long-chain fatty aldehyde decarbonylase [Kofleriaceae bacterium]|nr:long-chain fatty aldehyde decarbonylase [Kofleriaceae bacterium]
MLHNAIHPPVLNGPDTPPGSALCHYTASAKVDERISMDRIMGLAVFGEKVAARTYALMAELRPEDSTLLRKFAQMEGQHGTWFAAASAANGFRLDRDFADKELGYLIEQVDDHHRARDFDALAILQGFIVECLAIATYAPLVEATRKYPGLTEVFARALEEERYHVDWMTRYLRFRFFDRDAELLALVERVNARGVDCVGGTLMNITDYLACIGLSGADCAGGMTDEYTRLLERVGVDEQRAMRSVVSLFVPIIRKYRRGEKTK